MADEPEVEHSVTALYSGGPGEPYFQPVIECSCGWGSGRCESWAEAGGLYDDHLAEAPDQKGAE